MTGRTKNSTEKTSFVVFKYDFCKSRNLSSIEGTLPLDFLEMSSPEKYQECQTGFEKVMDSLLKSKKMTLVESRKNEEDVIHDNRILGFLFLAISLSAMRHIPLSCNYRCSSH